MSATSTPQRAGIVPMVLAYNLEVDFLHRSFHDFLMSPNMQKMLHEYSGGPFRASEFLIRSRLAQLLAIDLDTEQRKLALYLASFLIAALSTAEVNKTSLCETAGKKLAPVMERLAVLMNESKLPIPSGFYLIDSLEYYFREESTFLAVAIDFDLEAYVVANMTEAVVQGKRGRPILDHILDGRFGDSLRLHDFKIGNRLPNIVLLEQALGYGADPNQVYQGNSVWVWYLISLGRSIWTVMPWNTVGNQEWWDREKHIRQTHVAVIRLMLLHGARIVLPYTRLLALLDTLPDGQVLDLESINRSGMATVGDLLRALAPWFILAQDELLECIELADSILADSRLANLP